MIAALRAGTAHAVLRQLSAIGARLESRGDKIVLRAGPWPVPHELMEAAREAKHELAKMLSPPKTLNNGEGERLRELQPQKARLSAGFVEGAQISKSEHLRVDVSTFGGAEDFSGFPAHASAKVLTEAAHLSSFGNPEGFRGCQRDSEPKALNPLPLSIFEEHEGLRQSWEAEEERAGIIEHDGKIPRAWAEGLAQLDPERPPGDVPVRRWQRFVDDVHLFLDRWAAHAAALGWGPYELFGSDRDRPFARIDHAGLVWLLNGDRIVMLAEDAATLETRTGARQTCRRKPSEPGQVLAWELQ